MTKTGWIIGCLVAFLTAGVSHGQTVDATIDRNEIRIGEQAVVRLSVSYTKDRMPEVVFPVPEDHLPDGVEILRTTGVDSLETGDDVSTARLEQKLTVTAFDSGYYAFPPFAFVVNGDTQKTEAFLLSVRTVPIDTTAGPKNLKDIYEVSVNWRDYLALYKNEIMLGALGLLAILAALWFLPRYLNKRRSRPTPEPEVKARPADEIALENLERIAREKAFARGLVKKYHTEITDVIRDYLEAVADIPAHELTSRQIVQNLKYSGLSQGEMKNLREVLLRADMVKFAREKPGESENEAAVRQAREFIVSTAPRWMNPEKDEHEPAA